MYWETITWECVSRRLQLRYAIFTITSEEDRNSTNKKSPIIDRDVTIDILHNVETTSTTRLIMNTDHSFIHSFIWGYTFLFGTRISTLANAICFYTTYESCSSENWSLCFKTSHMLPTYSLLDTGAKKGYWQIGIYAQWNLSVRCVSMHCISLKTLHR